MSGWKECKRCEWTWFSTMNRDPKVCPKCKTPLWNIDRVKVLPAHKLAKRNIREKASLI